MRKPLNSFISYYKEIMAAKYYAVAVGRQVGIFDTWAIAEPLVKRFPGAKYKSFRTHNDASNYLELNRSDQPQHLPQPQPQPLPQPQPQPLPQPQQTKVESGRVFYTDGSCVDKYGGFGVVVVDDGKETATHHGGLPDYPTTNNRSELFAILTVVSNYPDDLLIRTDSEYSINGLTKYVTSWMRNGWKTSAGTDVKNADLIKEIVRLSQGRSVSFQHVYGHTGNKFNEMADRLANQGRVNYN